MPLDEASENTATQSAEQRDYALARSVNPAQPAVPGYALEELQGRGTFGEVWSARQLSSGQKVAVKLFRARPGGSWSYFRQEVERHSLVAEHPNIVTLLDADLEADPPYFVMNLYPGSLSSIPEPGAKQVVEWMQQIARALRHTHQRGLLHCDLKPSNVLVDVEGQAQLADFGQAVLRSQDSRSLGSLGFMAPEQADPAAQPDVRWDVYALGATAYFLLTGERPRLTDAMLRSSTPSELLSDYRTALAAQPLAAPPVDPDLAHIIESCLQVDPAERPEGMAEVLEDLDRRRQRRPLLSRRPWTAGYLVKRFLQRNALTSGFAAVTVTLLLLGLGLFYRQYQATKARLADQLFRQGWTLFAQGESAEAYLWWAEAVRLAPAQRTYRKPTHGYPFPLQRMFQHPGELHRIRFSPDGTRLLAGASDGSASLWSLTDGTTLQRITPAATQNQEEFHPLDQERALQAADFAPDGKRFVTSAPVRIWDGDIAIHAGAGEQVAWSPDGKTILAQVKDGVRLVEPGSGAERRLLKHPGVVGARFSPNGRLLLTWGARQVTLWRAADGTARTRFNPTSSTYYADFDAGGQRVVVPAMNGNVSIWDLDGHLQLRFKTAENMACVASFSRDGKRLVVGGTMGFLGVFDATTGRSLTPLKRSRWTPLGASFFANDTRILTYSYYSLARFWDAETGEARSPSFVNEGPLTSVCLSPDEKYLATASGHGTVRVFALQPDAPKVQKEVALDTPHDYLVVFAPDGSKLLTGHAKTGTCRLWDPQTGQPVVPAIQAGPDQLNLRANFSADGRFLAIGGHKPQVYDVSTGKPVGKSLPASRSGYFTADVSSDGARMATLEWDRQITFWNVASGRRERTFQPKVLAVSCAFSRDCKQFFLGSMDDTVRRVDVPHGQPEDVLQAGMFLAIKLREPDFLLTGSGDGNARLWSLRDTHPISRYMPHGAALIDLALSPNGDRVATATLDDKARLWSRTGEPLLPSLPHPAVAAVAFTPDGNSLMTASSTRIRFWDARLDSHESPEHLRTRLEVETGMHLIGSRDDLGGRALNLAPLTPAEWEERRRTRIRADQQ